MTMIQTITVVLGVHRAKNDTFDQNIDSWYCTCNGIRQYRSQTDVEQYHIAHKIAEVVGAELGAVLSGVRPRRVTSRDGH